MAIPSDPKYLEMASEAIAKFNAQGRLGRGGAKGHYSTHSALHQAMRNRHRIKRHTTMKREANTPLAADLVPGADPSSRRQVITPSPVLTPFALPPPCSGLVLTVYLEQTCRAVAAAVQLQAAWRCALLRSHNLPLTIQVKRYRAASLIQRAWRACE